MQRLSMVAALAVLGGVAAVGCGGDAGGVGDNPGGAKGLQIPTEVQSGDVVIVMRLTEASTTDTEVYASLNRIANEIVDLSDLLMRGGIAKDEEGEEILPVPAVVGGTAPEQTASFYETGGTTANAEDACGNPMIASYVTPRILAEVGEGSDDSAWPAACDSEDCDTLQWGNAEVVLSEIRFDGYFDMIVNIFPPVSPKQPAAFGHLVSTFLTPNNPGFLKAPVVLNTETVQLGLFNLWKRQKQYTHPGVGSRDVLGMPHEARTIDIADLLVAFLPQEPKDCTATWVDRFGGLSPYGCAEESAVLLDRNAPIGDSVWEEWTAEGSNPAALAGLVSALEWQVRTAAACPTVSGKGYVQDGPVELFICPDGDIDTCLATEDMDEYACRPVEGNETVLTPLVGIEPVVLEEARDFTVLRNPEFPLPPVFVGTEQRIELTVDEDTVLFAREAIRLVPDIGGPDLPEAVVNSHCEDDENFRYNLGEAWGPGTYTVVVEWTANPEQPELALQLTSIPTWVF